MSRSIARSPHASAIGQIEVVHAIPGRFRLRVAGLKRRPDLVGRALNAAASQPGVISARVNDACGSVVVEYDRAVHPELDPAKLLVGWLRRRGDVVGSQGQPPPQRPPLARPLSALAAVALSFLAGPLQPLAAALTVVAAVPIARRAAEALVFGRRLSVDQLDSVAVGTLLALRSVPSAAIMTALITLGDEIRERTARRSQRAAAGLAGALGRRAWVKRGGRLVKVGVEELKVGEVVRVYPGELIPVDGTVVRGAAAIDQKALTGESGPVTRSTGEDVLAGTVIADGKLDVKAGAVGVMTRAGSIARLMAQIPAQDTRMASYANRYADRFVGPTFGLAAMAGIAGRNPSAAAAILMVDFATGIRVAAPTGVMATIARAARDGVLIKGGRAVERLASVDAIIFDKTGTLTLGEPEVTDVRSLNGWSSAELLALAAGAEVRLRHPAARAVVRHAKARGVAIPERSESHYRMGLGMEAVVEGHTVLVGSERFMRLREVLMDGHGGAGDGHGSALYVAIDGRLAGKVGYRDPPRPESREVVARLRKLGIRDVLLVSGDDPATAAAVAAELGIEQVHGAALPDDKVDVVRALQRAGRCVAVVGDGINDAAALALADVSIAVRSGADIARETADAVLMESDLRKLPHAIELARDCVSIIRQDLAMVAVPNGLALALAGIGRLTPVTAALLNNGSGVLAALNSLRPLARTLDGDRHSATPRTALA